MKYRSTRGTTDNTLTPSQAIIQGLAPDGGLFVPVNFPNVSLPINKLSHLSYQKIAKLVLSYFFDDFSDDQLTQIIEKAYGDQWEDRQITPLSDIHSGNYYLELFHGPTLAFKDVALQALPNLMTTALKINRNHNNIVILTATSGDTGTASMRGFRNQPGTNVVVFYPRGGVSPVQLTQMLGQDGDNLAAFAIQGNFDNAQTEVKKIFNDRDFNKLLNQKNYQFSSANSMNIGRLVPQISYYLYAYGQLVQRHVIKAGEQVNFTVPTGNFGDILAGYYAKKLGLPINHLICASDENNVLTDFFHTGIYNRQRQFYLTNSPAMDILVSSNLERLLFDIYDGDHVTVSKLMHQLDENGQYQISNEAHERLTKIFLAGFAKQEDVINEIKRIYEKDHYLIDPHTAVASFVAKQFNEKDEPNIIVSTASPYKFPETVFKAVNDQTVTESGLAAIKELQTTLHDQLSPNVQALLNISSSKEKIIQPTEMEQSILNSLGL